MRRWLGLAIALVASPVHAGRTLYGWLPETDTLADGFELTTSIYERHVLGPFHERSTVSRWTPAVAITPGLELAFPIDISTRTRDDATPASGLDRYGVELRWSFLPHGAPVHSVARFAVSRNVAIQSQVRSELEVAAAYDHNRFHVAAALGGVLDVNVGHLHEELRPGFGASVRVHGELRLGAELYAELSRDTTATSWAVVGPDLAWARGQFWLVAMFGVGISNITAAPRLAIGMDW